MDAYLQKLGSLKCDSYAAENIRHEGSAENGECADQCTGPTRGGYQNHSCNDGHRDGANWVNANFAVRTDKDLQL